MARSDTITLLPLDAYAKLMAIQQCAFNQVFNPTVAYPQPCNAVWLQSAWVGTSARLVGRDEIATAVNMAEEMIAQALGFWPAPTWTTGDQKPWPIPRRGAQVTYPPFSLTWGHIIAAGVEDTNTAILTDEPIVYTDRDGDGVLDTATINITAAEMAAAGASWYEIAVYYPAAYLDWSPWPRDESWRIKPLAIALDPVTGNVELTGSRCQFVRPDLWDTDNAVDQSDAPSFITAVDIYRRYNDTTQQAQLVWQSLDDCLEPPCGETCQMACVQVGDPRNSIVKVIPATYSAGAWTYNTFSQCVLPDFTRTWYLSGFYKRLAGWMEADLLAQYNPAMAQAIARLANTYLPEAPCDCQQTQARWKRDREEMDINNLDTALAMSAFGTTMRGAVFAWSVIKRLNPLAGVGTL